jgi:hypothetical protein
VGGAGPSEVLVAVALKESLNTSFRRLARQGEGGSRRGDQDEAALAEAEAAAAAQAPREAPSGSMTVAEA